MRSIKDIIIFLWEVKLHILCLILVSYYLYTTRIKKKMNKMLENFYTEPTLPLTGHAHYFAGMLIGNVQRALQIIVRAKFPFVIWFFHIPVVFLGTPQDIKMVLKTTRYKGKLIKKLVHTIGYGIFVCKEEEWQKRRRIVEKALKPAKLQIHLKKFNQYSHLLIEKLEPMVDTGLIFNIESYMARMNVDAAFDNIADYKCHSLKNQDDRYFRMIEKAANLDTFRIKYSIFQFDFVYDLFLKITGQRREVQQFKNIILNKIITERIQRRNSHSHSSDTETNEETFVETLLNTNQMDDTYTKEMIVQDLYTMIQAAFAAPVLLPCYTLLMLAIHPDVQEKVYKEIEEIFGNTNRAVEMDDLDRLIYLEQCVLETLRKYPIAPLDMRQHSRDIVLNDKRIIPANCNIFVSILGLHRNPQVYSNPEIWDPNRFTVEAVSKRDKFAFIPFSAGPRTCPGAKYSMISTKVQLTYILRNYYVSTNIKMEDIKLEYSIVLRTSNGFPLRFSRRERAEGGEIFNEFTKNTKM